MEIQTPKHFHFHSRSQGSPQNVYHIRGSLAWKFDNRWSKYSKKKNLSPVTAVILFSCLLSSHLNYLVHFFYNFIFFCEALSGRPTSQSGPLTVSDLKPVFDGLSSLGPVRSLFFKLNAYCDVLAPMLWLCCFLSWLKPVCWPLLKQ